VNMLLNTLYVTVQGAYVHLDNETVRIEADGKSVARIPLHHLSSLVMFGNVLVSPQLLAKCAKEGRSVAYFDINGRFSCRIEGPVSGNILLRHAQYKAYETLTVKVDIARNIVAGKIRNTRTLQRRSARESDCKEEADRLKANADRATEMLRRLERVDTLDEIRGIEGKVAREHFEVFPLMIKKQLRTDFEFTGRNRRPPRDKVNAMLSFIYTLLTHDAVSAIEGIGLDPREGFLHAIRPGRPALALDLVEEFRAMLGDRIVLAIVNRRQIGVKDFDVFPGGSVLLNDRGRKIVLAAYQNRKKEMIAHPLFKEKVAFGLLVHIQARILARYLRKDIPEYLPMLFR